MTTQVVQLAASKDAYYAPDFELWIFNSPASPTVVKDIIEVKYEDALERIDGFTLTVNNWNAQIQRPIYYGYYRDEPAAEHPNLFEPGTELMLFMGWTGDTRLMMTGRVTSVDVQFPESGHSKLIVSGLNILDKLRTRQFTWTWPDDGSQSTRDSDVAKALEPKPDEKRGKPGFGIDVRIDPAARAQEPPLEKIVMSNQFPILFLMQRARERGYEVLLGEERDENDQVTQHLYFGPTRSLRDIAYDLEWGKSLISFHPSYSDAKRLYAATVGGYDRTAKKAISVRRTIDDLLKSPPQGSPLPNADHVGIVRVANREEVVAEPPARTEKEARERADAILVSSQQGLVEATGTTIGLPDLRAGRTVNIRGTGYHFDGRYAVVASAHTLNDTGYRTSFTARRVGPEFAS
jgi:phage protein D